MLTSLAGKLVKSGDCLQKRYHVDAQFAVKDIEHNNKQICNFVYTTITLIKSRLRPRQSHPLHPCRTKSYLLRHRPSAGGGYRLLPARPQHERPRRLHRRAAGVGRRAHARKGRLRGAARQVHQQLSSPQRPAGAERAPDTSGGRSRRRSAAAPARSRAGPRQPALSAA